MSEMILVDDTEIVVNKEDFEEMENDIAFLRALEGAGVDNWDGYEYAQDVWDVEMENK